MIASYNIRDFFTDPSIKGSIFTSLELSFDHPVFQSSAYSQLLAHLDSLEDTLNVMVEYNYVDKDFRDCYYHHYSTKLKSYARNCVRLSFFDPKDYDILSHALWADKEALQKAYRGFLILRPLITGFVGRNVIHPTAKKNYNKSPYKICMTSVRTSCSGLKLIAEGFPHSSQDSEYMSCAETTVWSVMQYFGNKYQEYEPELPSQIVESLKRSAIERLTPSDGLTYAQISLALMQQGFGCKIYYNDRKPSFKENLTCYIESGIPLAIGLYVKPFGHAVVGIGRKEIDKEAFLKLPCDVIDGKNVHIFNLHIDEFVFNDDNVSSYGVCNFNTPTAYDGKPQSHPYEITHFIAPLYSKIYVPAEKAIAHSKFFIGQVMNIPDKAVVRTFLASSRSYKEYIASNPDLTDKVKESFLSLDYPKFIWITEVSSEDQFRNDKISSLIILDATANNKPLHHDLALICLVNQKDIIFFKKNSRKFKTKVLTSPLEFEKFKGNIFP